jgi:hypothetical protein
VRCIRVLPSHLHVWSIFILSIDHTEVETHKINMSLRNSHHALEGGKCAGMGIDSKPPAYVAWRAGTITLSLLGFWLP